MFSSPPIDCTGFQIQGIARTTIPILHKRVNTRIAAIISLLFFGGDNLGKNEKNKKRGTNQKHAFSVLTHRPLLESLEPVTRDPLVHGLAVGTDGLGCKGGKSSTIYFKIQYVGRLCKKIP